MPPHRAKRSKKVQQLGPTSSGGGTGQGQQAPRRKQRKEVSVAEDVDIVLAPCRQLRHQIRRKATLLSVTTTTAGRTIKRSSSNNSIASDSETTIIQDERPIDTNTEMKVKKEDTNDGIVVKQEASSTTTKTSKPKRKIVSVIEMSCQGVIEAIERITLHIFHQILSKNGFSFDIPSRSASNQVYLPKLDRIVLGNKRMSRSILHVKEARKAAITSRVMNLLHTVLDKDIHITKRDLFYTDVKLFVDQSDSDGVLDDIATMIGCTRSNLHVVASDKGLVVGRIQFEEDGDEIDCTKMGVGGKAIPPYIDKIQNIRSDAEFVLLVEKEAAYMRMAEDRFYHRYPCVVITAKGQPDVATRMFLSRLVRELHIPVLGLVDADPYGLKILSVYMSGSKNMSYDSASLTTPDIKWLGLRPTDFDKFDLPDQCRLDMTPNDIRTGKELLKEEFIQKNKKWVEELELMIKMKKKAEIQALSSFGFQYITETYLPQKLRDGDWI